MQVTKYAEKTNNISNISNTKNMESLRVMTCCHWHELNESVEGHRIKIAFQQMQTASAGPSKENIRRTWDNKNTNKRKNA